MLFEETLFAPVLDTKAYAVPHAMRNTPADEGTVVRLAISSPVSRTYDVVRAGAAWSLVRSSESQAAAIVTMDADTFWRLFTHSISRTEAIGRRQIIGDAALADAVFDSLAIIA
jgi:hypothetical protein